MVHAEAGTAPPEPEDLVEARRTAEALGKALRRRAGVVADARAARGRPRAHVTVTLELDAAKALVAWLRKPS